MKRATEIAGKKLPKQIISIHALVKRATCHHYPCEQALINFNPRPREEGDLVLYSIEIVLCDFNPRPREEGDIVTTMFTSMEQDISIHALVKRATGRGQNEKQR